MVQTDQVSTSIERFSKERLVDITKSQKNILVDVEPSRVPFNYARNRIYQDVQKLKEYFKKNDVNNLYITSYRKSEPVLFYMHQNPSYNYITTLDGLVMTLQDSSFLNQAFDSFYEAVEEVLHDDVNWLEIESIVFKVQLEPWSIFGVKNIHQDFRHSLKRLENYRQIPCFIVGNKLFFTDQKSLTRSESFKNFKNIFKDYGAHAKNLINRHLYQFYRAVDSETYENEIHSLPNLDTYREFLDSPVAKILSLVGTISKSGSFRRNKPKSSPTLHKIYSQISGFNKLTDEHVMLSLKDNEMSLAIEVSEYFSRIQGDDSIQGIYISSMEKSSETYVTDFYISKESHLHLEGGVYYNKMLASLHNIKIINEVMLAHTEMQKRLTQGQKMKTITSNIKTLSYFDRLNQQKYQLDPFNYGL
jgi:hypothetical protein